MASLAETVTDAFGVFAAANWASPQKIDGAWWFYFQPTHTGHKVKFPVPGALMFGAPDIASMNETIFEQWNLWWPVHAPGLVHEQIPDSPWWINIQDFMEAYAKFSVSAIATSEMVNGKVWSYTHSNFGPMPLFPYQWAGDPDDSIVATMGKMFWAAWKHSKEKDPVPQMPVILNSASYVPYAAFTTNTTNAATFTMVPSTSSYVPTQHTVKSPTPLAVKTPAFLTELKKAVKKRYGPMAIDSSIEAIAEDMQPWVAALYEEAADLAYSLGKTTLLKPEAAKEPAPKKEVPASAVPKVSTHDAVQNLVASIKSVAETLKSLKDPFTPTAQKMALPDPDTLVQLATISDGSAITETWHESLSAYKKTKYKHWIATAVQNSLLPTDTSLDTPGIELWVHLLATQGGTSPTNTDFMSATDLWKATMKEADPSLHTLPTLVSGILALHQPGEMFALPDYPDAPFFDTAQQAMEWAYEEGCTETTTVNLVKVCTTCGSAGDDGELIPAQYPCPTVAATTEALVGKVSV